MSSEFKLDDIYYGVNSLGKNVRAHFFLRKLIFGDRWKSRKIAKIRARKTFLPHGKSWHDSWFGLIFPMMPYQTGYKVKKKSYGLVVLWSLFWWRHVARINYNAFFCLFTLRQSPVVSRHKSKLKSMAKDTQILKQKRLSGNAINTSSDRYVHLTQLWSL